MRTSNIQVDQDVVDFLNFRQAFVDSLLANTSLVDEAYVMSPGGGKTTWTRREMAREIQDGSPEGHRWLRMLLNSAAHAITRDKSLLPEWQTDRNVLPEDLDYEGPCWLAYENGEVTGGNTRCLNKFNEWSWNGDKHEDRQVVGWMPQRLPAPPTHPFA
jgi:hypothetical protein